jgi:signal transduction histidine kinase
VTRVGLDEVPLPLRRAPEWWDAVLGLLAAVLAVVVLVGADDVAIDPELHTPTAWVVLATAVGAAAVGLRRRRPVAGLVLVTAVAFVVSVSWHFTGLLPYLTMLALYAVAAHGTRRAAVTGLVGVVGSFLALALVGVPDLRVTDVVTSSAVCVAAVAVGDTVRQRRRHQVELLRAAEARVEVAARGAVAAERLRIAQEMHDVVAHSMSLIAVQAGVGAHVLHRDPESAERALLVIAETSRAALAQTRSVLGLLRSGDDAGSTLPGLVSLSALVQGVRDTGRTVQVTVEGERRELSTTVDLAAYRVVQEALTNAVRHAPGRPVAVRLRYTATELVVDVATDGDGVLAATGRSVVPGFGLVGLRERARAVGGHLDAGATADGGFAVSAHLPTGGAAR